MADQLEKRKKKLPVHEGYVDLNKLDIISVEKFLRNLRQSSFPSNEEMDQMADDYEKQTRKT